MKKTMTAIALAISIAFSIVPAFAAKSRPIPAKKAKPPIKKKIVSAVCPVMGSKIADVKKASGKSVYKGKTYYFCCAGCKPMFDKNPAKYVNKK